MTNPEAAYPNSSSSSSCSSTTALLLTLALLILSLSSGSIQTVDSESQGSREVEWQILTKLNFSYQIRLHPHILLLVTVPCNTLSVLIVGTDEFYLETVYNQ